MYKVAYTYLNNSDDAEDLVQDVFVTYYKSKVSFANEEHEKNWFIRVTVNLCINFKKSFWRKHVDKPGEFEASYDFKTEPIEMKDILSSLSDKGRLIIFLYYYEQYPINSIAAMMKMSESAVKMQLKRSREKLKEILGNE